MSPERLEKWANDKTARTWYIDCNIASPDSVGGIPSGAFVRNFVPSTWTLTLRGEVYELRPVIEALASLREAVAT